MLFDIYCLPLQPQIYKKMTELILSSLLIIAIGMAFFLVKVLSRRDGEFSSKHIHDSEAMRERGIHCVLDQDREMRTASRTAVKERLD